MPPTIPGSAAGPPHGAPSSTGGPAPVAVTVDLWYTLIYQRYADREAYRASWRGAWVASLRSAGLSRPEAARWARRIEAAARGPGPRPGLDDRVRWLSKATGANLPAAELFAQLDRALDAARIRLLPGALRFLADARERGVGVGLLSNITDETPTAVHRLLDRLGLSPSLATVMLSNETGLTKPAVAAWQECWRRLGDPTGPRVHVGDSPADVRGVERAGGTAWLFVGADRWSPRSERAARAAIPRRVPRFRSWDDVDQGLFGGRTVRSTPTPRKGR